MDNYSWGAQPAATKTPAVKAPVSSSSGYDWGGTPKVSAPATPINAEPTVESLVQSTPAPKSTGGLFSNLFKSINISKPVTPEAKSSLLTLPKVTSVDINKNKKEKPGDSMMFPVIKTDITADQLTTDEKNINDTIASLNSKNIDKTDKASVDSYNKEVDDLQKDIDAHNGRLTEYNRAQNAQAAVRKGEPLGQTIKAPFVDAGITVPSEGGIGEAYGVFKSIIETPEKAARSLSELIGFSKPDSDSRKAQYTVPSYAETAGKTTAQLIDEGIPPLVAVILGSAVTAGQVAIDVLVFLDPLAGKMKTSTFLEDAITKNKVTTFTPGANRYFNTREVADIWQTNKLLTEAEKMDVLQVIGGDKAKLKDALRNGISIQVPERTVITLEDKPYWAKIKEYFGAQPSIPKVLKDTMKPALPAVRGYLDAGKVNADAEKIREVFKKDLNEAIESHGTEATRQVLQEELGLDPVTAGKVIADAKAEKIIANAETTSKAVLAKVAPETVSAVNEQSDYSAITDAYKSDGLTTKELAETIIKKDGIDPVVAEKIAEDAQLLKNEGGNPDGKWLESAIKEFESKPVVKTEKPKPIQNKGQSRVFKRLQSEHSELQGELNYDVKKIKEEEDKATDLILKDKNKAFRIAMGSEESPDVLSSSVNIVLAEKALEEGNNALFAQLTKNRSLAQSRRGQEIAAEKGSVTDNSTARYVKDLISSRLESVGKKYLTNLSLSTKDGISLKKISNKKHATELIKKEVDKVKIKIKNTKKIDLDEAQKLLDSLICK